MKTNWKFSLSSRTNLVALVTVLAGFFKMFRPDLATFDGDPLQLITMGLGMIYLRESVGAK